MFAKSPIVLNLSANVRPISRAAWEINGDSYSRAQNTVRWLHGRSVVTAISCTKCSQVAAREINGDSYLVHKIQSGGWPARQVRRSSNAASLRVSVASESNHLWTDQSKSYFPSKTPPAFWAMN